MKIIKPKSKKIAIYSGQIPASTFTEHLINGVAQYHKVYLFGRLDNNIFKPYPNENITVYPTEKSSILNIF